MHCKHRAAYCMAGNHACAARTAAQLKYVPLQPHAQLHLRLHVFPRLPLTSYMQVYLAQLHQETHVAVKVLLSGMGASLATADDMQRALTLSTPMLDKLEEVSWACLD
jgi:hypothetical protein